MKSVKDFLWRYRAAVWPLGLIAAMLMVMQIEGPVIFTLGTVKITLVWTLGTLLLFISIFVFYFSEGEIK